MLYDRLGLLVKSLLKFCHNGKHGAALFMGM